MKILAEKLKPFGTEITPECQQLITGMKNTGDMVRFAAGLDKMTEWCSTFGKTEMGRWMEVLNDCDAILERAVEENENGLLGVDRDDAMEAPTVSVLRFTSLLFENTFSRSIYASMERLIKLLDCRKMWVMVQALRLLMVISKSSRFISQYVTHETRNRIYTKLMAILETWRGQLRTIPVNEFCSENYTITPNILNIHLRSDLPGYSVDLNKSYAESMAEMNFHFSDPSVELDDAEKALGHFKLRFAYCSKNMNERFYMVMARLIAISIFFYSRCLISEEWRLASLANDQFIEYCCNMVQRSNSSPKNQVLMDAVKIEALKTLASVVFLEKAKKIQLIVDTLELKTYHGFLPTMLRNCIDSLKTGRVEQAISNSDYSIAFVTSLFSLVYHIAGFEYGGDALNRSSMTSVLLGVVKTHSLSEQHISFVTRSVRIIDILTGMDVTEFNANDGTETVIKRFTHEIDQCRAHIANENALPMLCNQQRSALIKSLMNFLKRAVLDVHLATQMRRIMETELPASLAHIIQNPNYYGASLVHCSITLATNFIYQEPAQLAMLQDKGLTDAIMGLIFNEKFPMSRDLIGALPNVCSALCLNERGLNELKTFNGRKPLQRIFRIIFSNKFLQSMRKRKTEILETAHLLGTSFDELIRHHPSLRRDMMSTMAEIIDGWLTFEEQNSKEDKRCVISWGVGKSVAEEESVTLLPLGDFLAMFGIILETMLTNRGVMDNVQVANECGIALRLIKLITDAKQPNPIMLQSNYLHGLANILRYVMVHTDKTDEAFVHLVKSAVKELKSYKRCETADDVNSQDRLCQLTRLCALITTLNSLMKSSLHSQSTYEMRPYMLQYFATDPNAQSLIIVLFGAYKVIGTDRLVISCASQQHNAQRTTSQILEDTTKVRELLIDDEQSRQDSMMEVDHDQNDGGSSTTTATNPVLTTASNSTITAIPMEPDALTQSGSSSAPSTVPSGMTMYQGPSTSFGSRTIYGSRTTSVSAPAPRDSVSTGAISGETTVEPGEQHQHQNSHQNNSTITERSSHSVAIRSLKQISELMAYMGRAFCTVSFPRIRQRGHAAPMDQMTMRRHSQRITGLLFDGLKQLLNPENTPKAEDKANLGASHVHQSLSTLKKLLIDDVQNQALLLPNFYKSGCHHIFFGMVDECLRPNIAKEEFNLTIQAWLAITQRLISTQMLNSFTIKQKSNGQQQQQQKSLVVVEGFEPKHYLATCQKDAFAALVSLFKTLVEFCEQQRQSITPPVGPSVTIAMDEKVKEEEAYKLLEKVLDCMRSLLQGMMDLLELTEDKPEQVQEIPVSEIDPKKIEQLVEMGFSQSDAVDALMQHTSVPEAAEYLVSLMERSNAIAARVATTSASTATTPATITAPPTSESTESTAAATVAANVVAEATAAAIPVQQNEPVAVALYEGGFDASQQPPASTSAEEGATKKQLQNSAEEQLSAESIKKPFAHLKPLLRAEFQEKVELICREVVGVCLRLVRRNRSVALGLSSLLSIFANDALARSWVDGEFVERLIADLNRHLDVLSTGHGEAVSDDDEDVDEELELVEQISSLLMFFCQLWQNFPNQRIYKRLDQ